MLENFRNFFKKFSKNNNEEHNLMDVAETAKERLHMVLMQDRANVSVEFLDMLEQEMVDVVKKYVDVDESKIQFKITSQTNKDGSSGVPELNANIPIIGIKNENISVVNKK